MVAPWRKKVWQNDVLKYKSNNIWKIKYSVTMEIYFFLSNQESWNLIFTISTFHSFTYFIQILFFYNFFIYILLIPNFTIYIYLFQIESYSDLNYNLKQCSQLFKGDHLIYIPVIICLFIYLIFLMYFASVFYFLRRWRFYENSSWNEIFNIR